MENIGNDPPAPFVVTSVGSRIGIAQITALLYWPLIVASLIALSVYKALSLIAAGNREAVSER